MPPLVLREDGVEQVLYETQGAESVRKPAVGRARIDEMRAAELPDASQPLVRAAVDDGLLQDGREDVAVDRVRRDLGRLEEGWVQTPGAQPALFIC
jgi:hypothetical protein